MLIFVFICLVITYSLFIGENEAKYSLRKNPNSWNEIADVVFVEQPIRTGFSLAAEGTPIIRTEAQIGADFRKFLVSFLKVFPEYKGDIHPQVCSNIFINVDFICRC